MNKYRVALNRTDSSAGPRGSMQVIVESTDSQTAKLVAESTYRGYRAVNVGRA